MARSRRRGGLSQRYRLSDQQHPAVDRFMINVSTSTMMMIVLKPRAERTLSADQLIQDLRPKLNAVPGIRAMLVNPLPITIGGRRSRSLYQLTLQGMDTGQLYAASRQLERAINGNAMDGDWIAAELHGRECLYSQA